MATACKRRKMQGAEATRPEDPDVYISPVLGIEYMRNVELVDSLVCQILEKKETSRLVRELSTKLPLQDLQHLKRVRSSSSKGGTLEILIGSLSSIGVETDSDVRNHLHNHGVDPAGLGAPYIVPVPQYAPLTRQQFDESKQYWPSPFHEDKEIAKKMSGDLFSPKEVCSIKEYIMESVEMNGTNQVPRSGCVIVDPVMEKVIVKSSDHQSEHPLHHAVMVAIEEVSRQQREDETCQASADDDSLCDPDTSDEKTSLLDSGIKTGPYLCTGYDVYLSREPCVMCAMAMVHSRVKRVFYAAPITEGALGSKYRIHTQKGLNHHFDVFHVQFSESNVKSDVLSQEDTAVS